MNDEPTHLDLFSGIGGFALAARWAGFRTVGFSEIDPYASAVLRKHWPEVPNHGDIRGIGGIKCDLITGGFPCQPFSVAGKRRGKADDRHLWPEMLRVISECRPTWVVGENVAGFIKMELDQVLSDLEGIGYTGQPAVVPACAVDATHRRERVWVLAHSQRTGLEKLQRKPGHDETQRPATERNGDGWANWPAEPDVGRVAHGIPNRVDRLKGLGNAIVPQVAFEILRCIRQLIDSNDH